jgi:serine protease AprX
MQPLTSPAGSTPSRLRTRILAASAVVATLVGTVLPGALGAAASAAPRPSAAAHSTVSRAAVDPALRTAHGRVHIIVQNYAGVRHVDRVVHRLGGTVTQRLSIIHGFAATVPASAIHTLARTSGVRALSLDRTMRVQASPATPADDNGNNLPAVFRQVVGADRLATAGDNGHGVTVALIDTGVTPMSDLAGRLVTVATDPLGLVHANCVNFSKESTCNDTFGHGTFIAGLIAGNGNASGGAYAGTAPGAKVLSVKLAGADGSADVSQTLAAIQWVVSFRNVYNIKVLNLSLGTDSTQSYHVDPLDFAVEQAWKAGITVVVAASNRGPGPGTISKPGDDPFVITVGASDDNGTADLSDDAIPSFSSHGPTAADGLAKPDLVAPGTHLPSLAAPGSSSLAAYPTTMPAPYRRGSGTSFANGVVSGVIADMLSADGSMSPNRIKYALMSTARAYPGADVMAQGAGVPDGYAALSAPSGLANQNVPFGDGTGSIDLSRGSVHVDVAAANGSVTTVNGGLTATLSVFDPTQFVGQNWTSTTWWASQWAGQNWTGQNWTGQNWTGQNWTGQNWTGSAWYGQNWTGQNWTGQNWTGQNWTGQNWTGQNWTGSAWYGAWDH